MSKRVDCWLDRDWFDELSEYYNTHHDEIRKAGLRNFGHWLGAMAITELRGSGGKARNES